MKFLKNIRKYIWPIYGAEHRKFLPMMLAFLIISFNYNILRAAKDTLIITAPFSGAEAIPFIKLWIMLPTAFLLTYIFTRLSNRYNSEKVFYLMISIFIVFFAFFTFVLYPLRDILHPSATAAKMASFLPLGMKGFVAIFLNWTITLYYVMAEMWGTVVLTVLFWGFANNITPVDEAKRFYALFGVGANISGSLAGYSATLFGKHTFSSFIPYGKTAWDQSVLLMNLTVIIGAFLIMLIFRMMHKQTLFKEAAIVKAKNIILPKMSLRKNFTYLIKSKYLICIALIVLTYNITINLTEVIWKDQVKTLYPDPSAYTAYMGMVLTVIGILATIIALFVSGNLLRKFNWSITALLTPIIVLITGSLFFASLIFKLSFISTFAAILGTTPVMLSVFFGSMQNCFTRASKYTLFDASKEIAFIPLSQESKIKGKAAIDGIGSRIGKCGGALIYQSLLMIFSTLTASSPYVAVIFLIVVGVWLVSVVSLGKKFTDLTQHKEKIAIQEETLMPQPAVETIEKTEKTLTPL